MSTTLDDIRCWLKAAPKDSTHMLVVCDTFDYVDYPIYVRAGQDVRVVVSENNGPNMTRLMEVYSLNSPYTIEGQLAQGGRVHNYREQMKPSELFIVKIGDIWRVYSFLYHYRKLFPRNQNRV